MRLIAPIIVLFLFTIPVLNLTAQAPVAVDDSGTTTQSVPVVIDVLANDASTTPAVLDPATIDLDQGTTGPQTEWSTAAGGFTANLSTGAITFTPAAGFWGNATATYTVNDDQGVTSNVATVTIYVDRIPTANNDVATTPEDQAVNITILSNDHDEENAIDATSVDLDPTTSTRDTQFIATGGTFSVDAAGLVTFTPDPDFNGTASATYTVMDVAAQTSNSASVTVTVTAVNDKPVITDYVENLSTLEDTPITLLPAHFTVQDPDNPTFTIIATSGTNYTANGSTITPAPNYFGTINVSVKVSDGTLESDAVVIPITVTAVNDKPVITDYVENLSTLEDTPITLLPAHFTVQDPDNPTFTIIATSGTNYTADGSTITPAPNYFGTINVSVKVSDGTLESDAVVIPISVTAVNDAPYIQGQQSTLNTAEDEPITILLSHLTIIDPDDAQFTLTVTDGPDYSVVGHVVTPDLDVNGTLSVQVHVNDGEADSPPFFLSIQINPVNDRPVITGQQPLTIDEDTPLTIALSHITIHDPDNSVFDLSVYSGINYTLSGKTITPVPDYHGPLIVPIQVDDGVNLSTLFNIAITVNPVNDVPVISGQTAVNTPEDTPITLLPSHLNFSDVDNDPNYTVVVFEGDDYTFSGNTVTPDPDFNGLLIVKVRLNDGAGNSALFDLEVEVDAKNDAPVISAQVPKTIAEDSEITLQLSDVAFDDPDNTTGFILVVSEGDDYSLSGNTVKPDLNFNGTLTVPVAVHDGTDSSTPFPFVIQITAVNDPPVINGPVSLTTPEETALTIDVTDLEITDPDNTSGFILTVLPGSNYTLTGNTVTPNAEFNGTLGVGVRVNDGNVDSENFTLKVVVTPVNDPPVITGQIPLATDEDEPYTLVVSDLVISDPDNTTFSLILSPGDNYTVSGNVITPDLNYNGPLTIPVQVYDGAAYSNTFNVTLLVSSVNNEPEITAQVPLSTNEEQSITLKFSDLTVYDPDNTYPSGFLLIVQTGDDYSVNGQTVTPDVDFNGTLTVPVQVNDGIANSDVFELQITVNPINDAPVITGQKTVSTAEDENLLIEITHLLITDPDDDYPSGFTLEVLAGTNYTFSGNAITPATNFTGTLSVPVRVHDGDVYSAPFALQVAVTPVNDPPVITGQVAVSTLEDQPLTLQLLHLVATDPDNSFPSGFTLLVSPGTDYTVAGTTITPAPNFNGTLEVPVRINDGAASSEAFTLKVTVTPVNDRPEITGQNTVTTPEEQAITLTLNNLIVTDPDNTYPDQFTLSVGDGTGYTRSGNTITPATNFNGTLSVPVRVNDGALNSEVFTLAVQVTAVNDAPVITGQTFVSTNEDQPVTIQFSDLIVTDVDNTYPTGFTLTILAGDDYTFSNHTVTPAQDFSGTLKVNVMVNDGAANSNAFVIDVQVNETNDVPQITGQVALSINEEQAFTVELAHLIVTDPDNNYPDDFSLSVLSGLNYSTSGNTITPAVDLNGPLTVRVLVSDGKANSNTFNLLVQVNAVNDVPVITGQKPVTFLEDVGGEILLSHLLVSDPDNTYPDDFTLSVGAGTNYTRSGNTITPANDFTGTLTVPVTVRDGTNNSTPFNLQVQVSAVNDAPTITGQSTLTTAEDTPITIQVSDVTIVDPDNTSGFTLEVGAGDDYTFAGKVITPAADFNGTLTVPVTVSDGNLTSAPFNLKITVTPVNDVAVITAQSPVSTPEDTPITLNLSQLTYTDVDNTTGFSLVVGSGSNYSVSGNTITPATNFNGTLTIPVRVHDGTANSAVFDMSVLVTPVNDAPVITGQFPVSTNEEQSVLITLAHLKVTDPDDTWPGDFTLVVGPGTNYSLSGNQVIPATNFNGTLSVAVQVDDGTASSSTFQLQVTVNPVNDAPVISGQKSVSTNEDQSVTIKLTDLVVVDPDDTYPQDFTLSVQPGTNYEVTGTSITPATNFNGTLTVPVRVHDGSVYSNTFLLQVTVNPVNDAPVITGQVALATDEEKPIVIQLSHVTVVDPDTQPANHTLSVLSGANYSTSGTTVIPSVNFNGVLTVRVRVSDGSANSNIFNLNVTVLPVNDPPVITGQSTVSTPEETALTIQVSHLVIVDPDNSSGFSVTVSNGEHYTRSGNVITPEEDFNGVLTVPVRVSDGSLSSSAFDLKVQVTPVNDIPVIVGQKILSTEEDVPITLKVSDLTIHDPDHSTFTLEIQPGSNYTASGQTVTPKLDYNGTINVNVRVRDGAGALSAPFVVQIQVGDANDPPVITGQAALSVNEDATLTLGLQHFTVTDPDNTYPGDFTLEVIDGTNFTVSGNTVIPDKDFHGTLTVPVRVNDGVNNSALYNAVVTVNPVNDLPSFDPIDNQQVPENSGQHFVLIQNISRGPFEDDQFLVFIATSGNTNILGDPVVSFDGTSTDAELSYTLKPNISGVVTVTVRAVDNGNPSATFIRTFQIEVMEINAAPTLAAIADVRVQEDAAMHTVNLTGITAGPGETQPLAITVSTNNPTLFDPQPVVAYQSPASTGTLQLKPKADQFGSAVVSVTVTDNGSNLEPSVNHFTESFTFTVEPVNDAPVIESTPGTVGVVNEVYTYDVSVADIENEAIIFTFPEKPDWLTFTPDPPAKGTLSGSPTTGGDAVVIIVATDASGGSATQTFTLDINTRPALHSASISAPEDLSFALPVTSVYSDDDEDPMAELKITALPKWGTIKLGNDVINANTPVPASSFKGLTYTPVMNYFGRDTVRLIASDGRHYSATDTFIAIEIQPVNDAPMVALIESDTLYFEVNGTADFITQTLEVDDPDDTHLTGADIGFTRLSYKRGDDVLLFENTATITGNFDAAVGVLVLTGEATVNDYTEAIRSVKYNHLQTVDPVLDTKTITISLTDGKTIGPLAERLVKLTYTFTDLKIPSAFTPNGDLVNDTWYIAPPGGEMANAVIKVFDHRGVTVYESKGFEDPWDGRFNGELLPSGTYFYTIDLHLENKKTYKGTVTMLH